MMAALQGQNLNFQNIYEVFPHKRLGGGLGIYAPLPIPPTPSSSIRWPLPQTSRPSRGAWSANPSLFYYIGSGNPLVCDLKTLKVHLSLWG